MAQSQDGMMQRPVVAKGMCISESENSQFTAKQMALDEEVEEKFTKFSGEPRDARENLCNTTSNRQIFHRNGKKIARGDAGRI